MSNNKIFIAAGGTGGHIYPALSVARALKSQQPDIEIIFVGTPWGLENKMIPKEEFHLLHLSIGRLNSNVSKLERIKTLLLLPFAFLRAFYLILKHKPNKLIGMGGQVSGPLLFMASFMGKKTWIWEPNAVPGMANRHLSKFVTEGLVVFENCLNHMKLKKHKIVGLPIRKEIENIKKEKQIKIKLNILVFGGSQGSVALNEGIFNFVKQYPALKDKVNIVHQAGSRSYNEYSNKYASLPETQSWVTIKEYLHDMPARYQWADLVIARSGTGTLSELSACGLPSILVPLPNSADNHQYKNAKAFEEKNAAILIQQKELTPSKLHSVVSSFINNPEKLSQLGQNTNFFYKANAAESIAAHLLS